MKKIFIIFGIHFFYLGFSQEKVIVPTLISTFELQADEFVDIDSFGYYYYIQNNVFYKQKDKELFQYKNLAMGKISHVDLQNPLKIVLFYEGFNSVVTLDNQLNETQIISFSKNATPIVASAVGLASQNRLWVFDALTTQLGLYDFSKQVFQTLSQPFGNKICFYQTSYNYFSWINESGVIYTCDVFGKVLELSKVPNCKAVQFISNDVLLYQRENQLFYSLFKEDKEIIIDLGEKIITNFRLKDQFLIIFTHSEISTYQIRLP